ncbi:hypothetical protein D049_3084B, partial [Vibrio parahaemolyticus VPTS-2010]
LKELNALTSSRHL